MQYPYLRQENTLGGASHKSMAAAPAVDSSVEFISSEPLQFFVTTILKPYTMLVILSHPISTYNRLLSLSLPVWPLAPERRPFRKSLAGLKSLLDLGPVSITP